MKTYSWLIILIILIYGCKNKRSVKEHFSIYEEVETLCLPYMYNPQDSVYVNLEIYKVKNQLFSCLDSIIHTVEICLKKADPSKIGFYFSNEYVKGYNLVTMGNLTYRYYNPANSKAIFLYKGYKFYYEGDFIDLFFVRTGNFIQEKGVNPDKYMFFYIDEEQYWRYIIQRNKLQNIGYRNCSGHWHSENYIGVY